MLSVMCKQQKNKSGFDTRRKASKCSQKIYTPLTINRKIENFRRH